MILALATLAIVFWIGLAYWNPISISTSEPAPQAVES